MAPKPSTWAGMACRAAHARDGAGMIDYGLPRGHRLTPDEVRELGRIRARVCTTHDEPRHACSKDATDTAGPCVTTYGDGPAEIVREPVPWQVVMAEVLP